MSKQGERTAPADDWWNKLYDEASQDVGTGASGVADSLDDRFASAAGTLSAAPEATGVGEMAEVPDAAGLPAPEPPPGPAGGRGPGQPPRDGEPADPRIAVSGDGGEAGAPAGSPSPATRQDPPADAAGDTTGASGDDGQHPGPARGRGAEEWHRRPPAWWEHPPRAPWEPPLYTPSDARPLPPPGGEPPQDAVPPAPAAAVPRAPAPTAPPVGSESVAPPGPPVPPESVQAPPPRAGNPPAAPPAEPPRPADAPGAEPLGRDATLPLLPRRRPPSAPAVPPAEPASPVWSAEPTSSVPPGPSAPPAAPPEAPDAALIPPGREEASPPIEGPDRVRVGFVGFRPPTYDPEPTALPLAASGALDRVVPDTVLDGARYGTYTLRAASVRGDSARYRGEPRRDALLTARFGAGADALVLVAVAAGARAAESAHHAASDACRWIGEAVCRSHARLADDIKDARAEALKSGLQRLTDRTYGKLRTRAAELGLDTGEYATSLRCLLLSADPRVRLRVFFGVGTGGLFRLRDHEWEDLEPGLPVAGPGEGPGQPVDGVGPLGLPPETSEGDRLTIDFGIPQVRPPLIEAPAPPPDQPFRFHASSARAGDTLLLCGDGLAEPLRGEPGLAGALGARWSANEAPGLVEFLADVQLRAKGYADDRTAVGVWEA